MVHTEHWKNNHAQDLQYLVLQIWLWSHLPCGWEWFFRSQRWEKVSFRHHVIRIYRIYQNNFGIRSSCHESMTSFMLWFPMLWISPPKAFQKIDVISLKERGSFIKLLLHVGICRVEALPTVWTLDFFLPIVPFSFVLPWSRRLIMLLVFNSRLRSFEFSFCVILLLSFTLHIFGPWDMEGFITRRSDDPHLEKLVMFIS